MARSKICADVKVRDKKRSTGKKGRVRYRRSGNELAARCDEKSACRSCCDEFESSAAMMGEKAENRVVGSMLLGARAKSVLKIALERMTGVSGIPSESVSSDPS